MLTASTDIEIKSTFVSDIAQFSYWNIYNAWNEWQFRCTLFKIPILRS